MKRIFRWFIFLLMISCGFIFIDENKVFAVIATDYKIIEDEGVYNEGYALGNELINYSFGYKKKIRYYVPYHANLKEVYVTNEDLTINYTDIQGTWSNAIEDKFIIYKLIEGDEWEQVQVGIAGVCNPTNNFTGSCTISANGIYKVSTVDVSKDTTTNYIQIMRNITRISMDSYETKTDGLGEFLKLTFKVHYPFSLTETRPEVFINDISLTADIESWTAIPISTNKEVHQYSVNIRLTREDTLLITGGILKLNFGEKGIFEVSDINYDAILPIINGDLKYYNRDFISEAVTVETSEKVYLPEKSRVVFNVQEDSGLSVVANEHECLVELIENSNHKITCDIDANSDLTKLSYLITDGHGNAITKEVEVEYVTSSLLDHGSISEYVVFNEDPYFIEIDVANENLETIKKVCIIYGNVAIDHYHCTNGYSVRPIMNYQGAIIILAVDGLRYEKLEIDDYVYENGYIQDEFRVKDIQGTEQHKQDISTQLIDLILIACNSNQKCEETINVEVRYGNIIEKIEKDTEYLPTYLEILNKKFKDNTCATQACDKEVEVIVNYSVGGVAQSLSAFYQFVDKLPYIKTEFSPNTTIDLEYKKIDILNKQLQQQLFADNLPQTLEDPYGNTFEAILSPVIIEYTDLQGNVIALNNESYTYLENASLGKYLIEVRTIIGNDRFGKSLFLTVNVKDTILPTFLLNGAKEVKIKQYDIYKDEKWTCEDLSGVCNVNVTYYLNEEKEENIVNEVDTNIVGKYIIKYDAIDIGGNKVTQTRIVEIMGVNSLDNNSIIVIIVVVVVFTLFISIGILIEVKKNKRKIREE